MLIGREVATGEIDVFVTCLHSPDWLHRAVGEATLLENKWKANPIETSEISVFHDKVKMATANCKVCYLVSMSGFTSKRNIGAKQLIQSKEDPKMVGWTEEDILEMISDGTPEYLIRDSLM